MSRPKTRAALMEELEHAVRRSSAQGVLFGQTVANRVGLSNSDMECLDFLILEGRVTAGRLAEVFGLLLLFAAFFSAVLLAVTSFARSFKEAQAYLIPLMLVSMTPGITSETRMPVPNTAIRSASVNPTIANLVALYAA